MAMAIMLLGDSYLRRISNQISFLICGERCMYDNSGELTESGGKGE